MENHSFTQVHSSSLVYTSPHPLPSLQSPWQVAHGLCDHRDVAFNLDLHVWGVAAEACLQILDRLGCTSHSRFPLRWPTSASSAVPSQK